MAFVNKHFKTLQILVLLMFFFMLCLLVTPDETNILWRFPALFAGFPGAINGFAEHLMYDWFPVEVYDSDLEEYETSALIRELTRGFSGGVLFCIQFVREILLGGVKTIVAFTSWDFVGDNKWAVWPALPWTVVLSGTILLGYALKGKLLALLAGITMHYSQYLF